MSSIHSKRRPRVQIVVLRVRSADDVGDPTDPYPRLELESDFAFYAHDIVRLKRRIDGAFGVRATSEAFVLSRFSRMREVYVWRDPSLADLDRRHALLVSLRDDACQAGWVADQPEDCRLFLGKSVLRDPSVAAARRRLRF